MLREIKGGVMVGMIGFICGVLLAALLVRIF
jgi:tetrahydromethanopterin S-methyltransferase subunit F